MMPDREKVIKGLELCKYDPDPGQEDKWNHSCLKCPYCWSGPDTEPFTTRDCWKLFADSIALLKEQPEIVRCKDCKHWDKTTREEGNDCILGTWEDAVCDMFRDWDHYGELGENFRRTNGDWFCADGKRR